MYFLEHAGLSRIAALLKDLDVGDRLLCGRLELFSTENNPAKELDAPSSKPPQSQQQQPERVSPSKRSFPYQRPDQKSLPSNQDIEEHSRGEESTRKLRRRSSSVSSSTSLLGASSPAEGLQLLVHLVTTLNACFPDYDFSFVTPKAFMHVEDFVSVYTAINYHLSFLAERVIPGFLQDLWSAIKDAVDLRDVSIYSYNSARGSVECDPYLDDEGCLFSFDYFFVNLKQQRIFFFSCVTKQKNRLAPYDGYLSSPMASISEDETTHNKELRLSSDEDEESLDEIIDEVGDIE